MKYFTLTILTVLLGTSASFGQCSDLFFSEYIEGSSSNKAFEIYNPTSATIDLSDYVVYRNNNGFPTPTDSLFPVGMLLAGDVFVVGNPSGNAAIMAASDTTHTMTFYNGDDAMYLVKISTSDTLDIIGEIGVDPGAGWTVGAGATNNFTLIRKMNVQQGQTVWTIGQTQWDVFPIDMTDSLGGHSMIACGTPCTNTSSTITPTACDSYTAPDGMTYSTTGTYTATIPNMGGCDSVITIDLTINTFTSSSMTEVVCDSFSLNGTTYSFTGIYTQTLTNAVGCDSIITLDLDVTHTPSVPMVSGTTMYCEGETATALTVGSVATDSMIISGVADATLPGGLPKAVEFYILEDIADLSTYGFGSANNGGGTDGEEFTFPAVSVTAGTYIHVATDSTNFFTFYGFYPDYTDPSAGNVNGDDAIELFHNGAVIDVYGDINTDGTGEAWEYLDGWAYRATNATPNGGVFNLGEWTLSGINALDGASDNATSGAPFPIETYTYAPPTAVINWYDDVTLLNMVGTGATFTPTASTGTTSYYVTATASGMSTCPSAATQVDVVFDAIPNVMVIASDSVLCEGELLTLSGSGATSYSWDNGVMDGVPFAVTTATTSFTVTGSNGNCSSDATYNIFVLAAPSVAVTQAGPMLTADQAGATYQWIDCANNDPIAGATNQSYTPDVTGDYAVIVTSGTCSDTSACYLVDYTSVLELGATEKELVKIVDLMGRETPFRANTPLIYIYSDGTTERIFSIEK